MTAKQAILVIENYVASNWKMGAPGCNHHKEIQKRIRPALKALKQVAR